VSRKLIILRPQPGLDETLQLAQDAGLEAYGMALAEIRPRAWSAPEPSKFDGLLLGSANAIRHGGPELARLAGLPAWCMGEATAAAVREAGLEVAATAKGGIQQLLDDLAGRELHLLRLAGADHVALAAPDGISIETRIAYAQELLELQPELAEILPGSVVMLHSAVMAEHFASECDRLGLDRSRTALACIGSRVEEAAGTGWQERRSASMPDGNALLALAQDMCQTALD
jgi:uroporphyrinogen-III synthase